MLQAFFDRINPKIVYCWWMGQEGVYWGKKKILMMLYEKKKLNAYQKKKIIDDTQFFIVSGARYLPSSRRTTPWRNSYTATRSRQPGPTPGVSPSPRTTPRTGTTITAEISGTLQPVENLSNTQQFSTRWIPRCLCKHRLHGVEDNQMETDRKTIY